MMAWRQHIQNMLNRATQEADEARERRKLSHPDATFVTIHYKLDALEAAVKALANGLDNLKVGQPDRLGDEEPPVPKDETT